MNYTTYFEIGGHVIENEVDSRGLPGRPPATDLKRIAKQTGVPAPLLRQASKDVEERTGYDPIRGLNGLGRMRRAQWAFTTAGALAAVDGPLPIGDALAVGFLAGYGLYEVGRGITEIVQM